MGTFLKECFLQKTNQYDALRVWEKLRIGVGLYLYKEGDLVKVRLKDGGDKSTIGVLSSEDANSMMPYLKAKWNSEDDDKSKKALYTSIISRKDDNADENKRISISIFIEGPK